MNPTETASTVARYVNVWRNRPSNPSVDEILELLELRAEAFTAIAHWASERGRLETEAAAWGVVSDARTSALVLRAAYF